MSNLSEMEGDKMKSKFLNKTMSAVLMITSFFGIAHASDKKDKDIIRIRIPKKEKPVVVKTPVSVRDIVRRDSAMMEDLVRNIRARENNGERSTVGQDAPPIINPGRKSRSQQ
jgi:hypothetical protein